MEAYTKSILVVDDQEGVCQLLQELLASEGFSVNTASNGYEALEQIEKAHPGILIIDMKMPGMSGIDVLIALQDMEHDCLIIMMTAYGELEIVREAAKLGVSHFITKPFDIDELRGLIKDLTTSSNLASN